MARKSRKKTSKDPVEIMVVNDAGGDECRIAILVDDHLDELYAESAASSNNVGNIYKGRVVNVEPAIQAAFVDFGEGQNGFLHISDLHPRYFPGDENTERVGRKMPHRERPPIQEALKRGQEVVVQVLKEGIGTKGPTLTTYLSIPGRLLVSMPHMDKVGVSRKVEDDDMRREMRKVLDSIELPEGFGFIMRTAGVGRPKTEIKRDVAYLSRLWKAIEKRQKHVNGPCELYTESDVLIRTVRDVLRPGFKAIIVDTDAAYEKISAFLQVVAPRSTTKVIRYRRHAPIFHAFNIERQIDLIHSREVPLQSGGALVIDQTEALVAIDVNSGKSRSARDSETNAFQTNCEAIDEICRQLRLRDLGGLVILDLIDMRHIGKRKEIESRMRENLKRDRAKTTALRISEFGLMQLTRQRMRPSMRKAHFVPCPNCQGHGEIRSPESVATGAVRQIEYLLQFDDVKRIEMVCSPRVASVLLSGRRRQLVEVEQMHGKSIDVRVSDAIATDRIDFYAYDSRNADIDPNQLPNLKIPKVDELAGEDEAWDPEQEADDQAKSTRKRRRRRRKPGPADATAIALSGGFDIDDEDEDDEDIDVDEKKSSGRSRRKRKRSRRGGRSRRKVEYPSIVEEASTVRVHSLAKALEIKSKDILDRVSSDDALDIELKSHMSSMSADEAKSICDVFLAPAEEEVAADTAEEDDDTVGNDDAGGEEREGGRRRRRRGRRGGKRRRRGGAKNENGDAPESSDEVAEESDGDEESGKKTRRRRRGGKKKVASDDNGDSGDQSDPKPEVEASDESGSKKKKKTRKKSRAKTAETKAASDGDDAAPPKDSKMKKTTSGRKKKKKTKAPASKSRTGDDGAPTVEVKADEAVKPRRSLYRTRRKVSATARTIAEKADDA